MKQTIKGRKYKIMSKNGRKDDYVDKENNTVS